MAAPTRGNLNITVRASKPTIVARDPYLIYVNITNPFDEKVVINRVETYVPNEWKQIVTGTGSGSGVGVSQGIQAATIELQPGDSYTFPFPFHVARWLLFVPIAFRLQIQITYNVDDSEHYKTVDYELAIQSNFLSILAGAAIGAILGSIARFLSTTDKIASIASGIGILLVSVILSVAVVVAFARKSGVQPILTIEDFWGGALIGFLVGYNGAAFYSSILGSGSEVTPTVTPSITPTATLTSTISPTETSLMTPTLFVTPTPTP